jgi:hypothetical protein
MAELAAVAEAPAEYGTEYVVALANGKTIRTDSYAANAGGSSYVRVCNRDGEEIAYWIHNEWESEPELVMGAILGACGPCELVRRD